LVLQEIDFNAKLKQIELALLENERKKMIANIHREDKAQEEKKKQEEDKEHIKH
jgi:hypothetical protein